jgi:hypothetical protein
VYTAIGELNGIGDFSPLIVALRAEPPLCYASSC